MRLSDACYLAHEITLGGFGVTARAEWHDEVWIVTTRNIFTRSTERVRSRAHWDAIKPAPVRS